MLISSYEARSRQEPVLIRGAITVDDQKTLRVLARDYVEKTPRKVLALPFSNWSEAFLGGDTTKKPASDPTAVLPPSHLPIR